MRGYTIRAVKPLCTREPEATDRLRTAAAVLGAVVCIVTIIFLARDKPVIALLLMPVPLALLICWHAAHTAYRCRECGHEFTVSAWQDACTPQFLETKYLKCPQCGLRSWAKALVRG